MTDRTKNMFSVFCLIGVLAVAGFYFLNRPAPKNDDSIVENVSRELPVSVITAKQLDHYERSRSFTGKIFAHRTSELGFKLGGKVTSVFVENGQRVKSGEKIASLDTRDLAAELERTQGLLSEANFRLQLLKDGPRKEVIAAARAQVEEFTVTLSLQTRNLQRRERLRQTNGAISAEDYETSQFSEKAARAQLSAAVAKLEELEAGSRKAEIDAQDSIVKQLQSSVKKIEVQLEDSVLKAPFDGVITKRYVDEGQIVQSGTAMVRLVEDTKLEARIGIPISLVDQIQKNTTNEVVCNGKTFKVFLRSVIPEINLQTQTRTAIFDLEQATNLPIPGEIVRVNINRKINVDGFWVPVTSLKSGRRGLWSIYVANELDGNLTSEQRDVEILFKDEVKAFVRGTIDDGDQVIAGGIHRLAPEQRVSIQQSDDTRLAGFANSKSK